MSPLNDARARPLRVCVVAEFYPRRHDPVLGVWAHRQAVACRDAGAEVHVLVLDRPVPPRATRPRDLLRVARTLVRQPRRATIDGIPVTYVRFLAPPRPTTYGSWGRWAHRPLRRALHRLRRDFDYDLIHAHNAVPAGDAVLRALRSGPLGRWPTRPTPPRATTPVVVSVHGGDVYHTAPGSPAGRRAVRSTLSAAALVLANSSGTAERCRALGASRTRVVRLGTDLPDPEDLARWERSRTGRRVVTLGHLVARKGHADVLRALAMLSERHPQTRYRVVGDGPERDALGGLAAELGLTDRVEWIGQLPHDEALEATRQADLFVMPSTDEAFGVAYVEAMAAGIPAVGVRGESGPDEIAAAGPGIALVSPADVGALAEAIGALLGDDAGRREAGAAARRTVASGFSWERCGRQTVRAYAEASAAARAGPG